MVLIPKSKITPKESQKMEEEKFNTDPFIEIIVNYLVVYRHLIIILT